MDIWGVTQCKTRAGKTICQQVAYLPTGRDAGKLTGLINTSVMTDDKPWHATFPRPGNKLHSTCLYRKPLTRQRSQCRMQGKEREDHLPCLSVLGWTDRILTIHISIPPQVLLTPQRHVLTCIRRGNQPWMMDEYVEWVDHMFIRCVKEPLKTCPKVMKSNEAQVHFCVLH